MKTVWKREENGDKRRVEESRRERKRGEENVRAEEIGKRVEDSGEWT